MENWKTIRITRVTSEDIDQLQKISRQTFFETFSADNTEENMRKYLEEELYREKLAAELNNQNSQFYFAEYDNKNIGYLKLNLEQAQTELKDNKAVEIERIYVLKEFQGKKAGSLLFEKAVEIAALTGAEFIWLGVWEKNHKAISFYRKNGFIGFDRHIFKLGDDLQTDIMMKLHLNKNNK